MRRFLTGVDIEVLSQQGQREIVIDEQTVLTSVAHEVAERLGVKIVRRDSAAQVSAQTSSKGEPAFARKPSSSEAKPVFGVLPRKPAARAGHARPGLDLDDAATVEAWKQEFPILRDIIHVGNCSQSPQSVRVRQAIETYLDNWLTVGMDWEYWMAEVNRAKAEFARLINADPDEIAVSTSVSEAVSSVASALEFSKRRKVVATEAEFPTVGHVWLAHQKYGGKVEFVPVRDGEVRMEDYERYIDEDTLIASVTHVYYQNGFMQDIGTITKLAHDRGALVLVDAYQSAGTIPIDVKALDVDILTTGNLKYLLGIPGIAFLYVRKELVPKMKPAVTGWFGQENPFAFKVHYLDYASTTRRFDTGTPPVMPAFAARAGMEIINEVGPQNIWKRIQRLSTRCIEGARARGMVVASPLDVTRKGATTAIRVPDPHAVEEEMKRRNIIVSARGDVIRIAPHFFTAEEDIDRVLDELRDILK